MTRNLSKMTGPTAKGDLRTTWHFTQVVESCGIRPLACSWWYRPAQAREHNNPWMMDAFGLIHAAQAGGVFENAFCSRRSLAPGHCAILFPGVQHRYGSLADWAWEERLLLFDGDLIRGLAERGVLDPRRPLCAPTDALHIQKCFDACVHAAAQGREFDLCPLIFEIIHVLTRSQVSNVQITDADANITDIAKHMQREPQRSWDGKHLATSIGLSYSGFRQAFARVMGMPPHRYILHERMHLACRLLCDPQPITQIAKQVGIPDPARFARLFKQIIGYSPRKYRSMQARMR
jgi:AraC-like DNA-binding protein